MRKRVLVIGAGIAGLSAASYLQRNDFDTEIVELHDKPGGLCSAWTRNGFTFDGCIHWLMGSGPSSYLHRLWEELGAGSLSYIEWDKYIVVRLPDGDSFTLYTDPDSLEAEIIRLGPEDGAFARLLSAKIKEAAKADMPMFAKRTRISHRHIVNGLKNPKLRAACSTLFGDSMRDFPAGFLLMMLSFMAKKSAGYPIGGSSAFARAIEAKYLSLGGNIRYGAKVDEILVEGCPCGAARAVGVRGAWGELRGDYIVSAADGRDTLDRMLGGEYRGCEMDRVFDQLEPFPSLIFVGLGLDRDCSGLPHMLTFDLDEALVLESGALVKKRLTLRTFNFDPSLAPKDKTAAVVMLETANDAYWTELAVSDPLAYAAEKKSIANAVVAAIEREIAGFSSWVVAVDVATPRTYIRYTNNWHGSFEGWLPTPSSIVMKVPRTIPGIEGFEMTGQWVNPGGGLPTCAVDGRNLAKRLCKAEGREFRAD
jgi:phytoene dehydrogenase-like protein